MHTQNRDRIFKLPDVVLYHKWYFLQTNFCWHVDVFRCGTVIILECMPILFVFILGCILLSN